MIHIIFQYSAFAILALSRILLSSSPRRCRCSRACDRVCSLVCVCVRLFLFGEPRSALKYQKMRFLFTSMRFYFLSSFGLLLHRLVATVKKNAACDILCLFSGFSHSGINFDALEDRCDDAQRMESEQEHTAADIANNNNNTNRRRNKSEREIE